MSDNGWSTVTLCDSRYDCVINLVSAANGATEIYTTEFSNVRTQTAGVVSRMVRRQERKALDVRNERDCWVGRVGGLRSGEWAGARWVG